MEMKESPWKKTKQQKTKLREILSPSSFAGKFYKIFEEYSMRNFYNFYKKIRKYNVKYVKEQETQKSRIKREKERLFYKLIFNTRSGGASVAHWLSAGYPYTRSRVQSPCPVPPKNKPNQNQKGTIQECKIIGQYT